MTAPVITANLSPNPASGNLTADGNANVIAGGNSGGTYKCKINLVNMADGDTIEHRAFSRAYSSDGVVSGEVYGSGTGAQTQFLHALGGGLTGMTLNQTGVVAGTTGNITVASQPTGIPQIGQFYVANITRAEWAVASWVNSTTINLVTRGALGTTAAAWTTGDALTIANVGGSGIYGAQCVMPGSISISAPSSVTATDTAAFGNPATTGAPNGLSGTLGGTGVTSGIVDYATGACVVTFSSAPASGSNNITVGYSPLFEMRSEPANNRQQDMLMDLPVDATEGAILYWIKQTGGTNRTYRVAVENLYGT